MSKVKICTNLRNLSRYANELIINDLLFCNLGPLLILIVFYPKIVK